MPCWPSGLRPWASRGNISSAPVPDHLSERPFLTERIVRTEGISAASLWRVPYGRHEGTGRDVDGGFRNLHGRDDSGGREAHGGLAREQPHRPTGRGGGALRHAHAP